jgi:hypothetical protein
MHNIKGLVLIRRWENESSPARISDGGVKMLQLRPRQPQLEKSEWEEFLIIECDRREN